MDSIKLLKKFFALLLTLGGILFSESFALAAGGVEFVNYYAWLLHAVGVHDDHLVHEYAPLCASVVTLVLLTIIGLIFRSSVDTGNADIRPPSGLGIRAFFENVLEFVIGLAENIIGKEAAAIYLPLLCTLFLYIFVSNMLGLVPGLPPATESLSANLAMGITVFLTYNFFGFKENGLNYAKHFLGPIWWLAPLFLTIELVGHLARPISLSLRLYGNIFGDHLVMSVVTGLVGLVIPLVCLVFGTVVATVQSLVFTLLSSVYISMAITHEDH